MQIRVASDASDATLVSGFPFAGGTAWRGF